MSQARAKRRFSAEEARAAVLAAGVELLEKNGMDTGVGRVSLNDAIQLAGVPRGSAYRLWADDELPPQEAFRDELLVMLIRQGTVAETDRTLESSFEALGQLQELVDSRDAVLRGKALRQILRVGTEQNLLTIVESSHWYAYLSSLAAAHYAEPAPSIVAAHEEGELAATMAYVDLYKGIGEIFALRLRHGITWHYFATLAGAGAQGAALRWKYSAVPRYIERPTGLDGEMQEWTLFGIVFEGLVLANCESDPESDQAPTDLSTWSQ